MEALGTNFHICRTGRRKLVDLLEVRGIQSEALWANYEFGTKFVSPVLPNLNHSNSPHAVGRIQRSIGRIEAGVGEKGQVFEMNRYPSNAPHSIR